jgi:hypothetical protein
VSDDLYRVIHVDQMHCWLYILGKKNSTPKKWKIKKILTCLQDGLFVIEGDDPQSKHQLVKDEDLTIMEHVKRDYAYKVVLSMINNGNTFNADILVSSKRADIIRGTAQRFGISAKTVLRYLRQYWENGMTKDAMLPNYARCGGKNRKRNHTDVKLGRHNATEKVYGKANPMYDSDTQRMIMDEALRRHYKPGVTYLDILDKILADYYTIPDDTQDKTLSTQHTRLVAPEYRLTYKQLYRYIQTEWDANPKRLQQLKHGTRRYDQNHRSMLGNASAEAYYPGAVVQLDPTPLDINLVFTLQRYIVIGTPTVYLLVDMYSKAIVGFSIAIKRPSWRTALPALVNTFNDKVQFCNDFGIAINADEWPMQGLPKIILSDNGEFVSLASTCLPQKLDVTVQNAPSYRCDFKGLVERKIGYLNQRVRKLDGGKPAIWNRGDANTEKKACLTTYELTQILILTILYYNNHHHLKDYVLDADQIADQVPPIPNALWTWGVANRGGKLRSADREKVMLNLLPECHISITSEGFRCKGRIYHSDNYLLEDQLAVRSRAKGRNKFDGVYDPWHPDTIYCQLEPRRPFEILRLADEYKDFKDLHIEDWNAYDDHMNESRLELTHQQTQARITYKANVNTITGTAKVQTNEDIKIVGKSKNSRAKNKKDSREIEHELQQGEYLPAPNQQPSTPDKAFKNMTGKSKDQYVAPPKRTSYIRSLEQENSDDQE